MKQVRVGLESIASDVSGVGRCHTVGAFVDPSTRVMTADCPVVALVPVFVTFFTAVPDRA